MDNNASENPFKSNSNYSILINHVKGNVIPNIIEGNENTLINYVSGYIKINEENIDKMAPVFQESIKAFTEKLDELLRSEKQVSKQSLDSIKTSLTNLTKEFEDVDPEEEIKDEELKKRANNTFKDLAYKIVGLSPQVVETIVSMTPLSPFCKPIGKGVSYLKDLIQHKLSEP